MSLFDLFGYLLVAVELSCLVAVGREARATLHGIAPRTYSMDEKRDHIDALVVLIKRYTRIGRLERRPRLHDLLQSLYPECPDAIEMLAELHARRGAMSEAAEAFARAARQAQLVGGFSSKYIERLGERREECLETAATTREGRSS